MSEFRINEESFTGECLKKEELTPMVSHYMINTCTENYVSRHHSMYNE